MNEEQFHKEAAQRSIRYRAVCTSKDAHWKGKWREQYHEAGADAKAHRNGGNGQNRQHKIKIEFEQRTSALFEG